MHSIPYLLDSRVRGNDKKTHSSVLENMAGEVGVW